MGYKMDKFNTNENSEVEMGESKRKGLTPRQEEILEYIKKYSKENRMPPTVREIGNHFDISSTNGVRSILAALIKKGYINRSPRLSRGIEILNTDNDQPMEEAVRNPHRGPSRRRYADSRRTEPRRYGHHRPRFPRLPHRRFCTPRQGRFHD